MDDSLKSRLTSGEFWTRALYMVLFAIAYSVAEVVLTLVVIFQFVAALVTGRVNEPLLKLGQNLSSYIYQIVRFETFNTEERPFPFSDWPDDAPDSDHWLRPPEPEAESEADAPAQPETAHTDRGPPGTGEQAPPQADSGSSQPNEAGPDDDRPLR